jgi:hypothetical protein
MKYTIDDHDYKVTVYSTDGERLSEPPFARVFDTMKEAQEFYNSITVLNAHNYSSDYPTVIKTIACGTWDGDIFHIKRVINWRAYNEEH